MNALPPGWSTAAASELFKKIVDGSHNPPAGQQHGLPMLSARNIYDDRIMLDNFRYISESDFAVEHRRTLITPGDVLLTIVGTIGRSAVVSKTDPPFTLQRSVAVLTPRIPKSGRYWMYQFQAPHMKKVLAEKARGTAQKGIYLKSLSELVLRVAPLQEQERIVAEIEKQFTRLDDAVAALKRVQVNLKRYRASVLKAACEGRLVPTEAELGRKEGRSHEPASELLIRILSQRRVKWEADQLAKFNTSGKPRTRDDWKTKYQEPDAPDVSKLPELPEGWVWASVDQLALVVRGASPRPAGDPKYFGGSIPWITVGALTADEQPFLLSVSEFVTDAGRQASRYIEPDTLLLTNSGATLGVPKITLIGGCINDGSVALLGIDYPLKLYLYYFLFSQTLKLRAINQGAAQPNLNTTIVKQIAVPLPPAAEQARIVATLERQISTATTLSADMKRAHQHGAALRRSILRSAFEGNLVPQHPDDEPGSVLLEQILGRRHSPGSGKGRRAFRLKSNEAVVAEELR